MPVPSAITRSRLRHLISRALQDRFLGQGTATGASSTLIDTDRLIQAANYWNGWRAYIYSGTGSGQAERLITGSDPVTGSITVRPNWTTAPTSASLYELHKKLYVTEYNDFIEEAIREVQAEAVISKVDETTTLAVDDYEYNVPSGFSYIHTLWVTDPDDESYEYFIPLENWWIEGGATPKIKLHRSEIITPGYTLKVEGQGYPTIPTADTDTIDIDATFLLHYALSSAHAALSGQDSPEAINHGKRAEEEMEKAENARAGINLRVFPGSRAVQV